MTPKRSRILIATNNVGKAAELSDMLQDVEVEVFSLAGISGVVEVEETGADFAQNARLKASGYAVQAGMLSLADDSGLEVEALAGRPGVHSARYGGYDTGYNEKIAMLLGELEKSADNDRRARFVCAIAVSDETGRILHEAEGICRGKIALEPRGNNGFGYDPVFIPDGFEKTFGELADATKAEISHRSRAFRLIIPFLRHFIAI